MNAQGQTAQLVGRAHIQFVGFAVPEHSRQMDHPGNKKKGKSAVLHQGDHLSHSSQHGDSFPLPLMHQGEKEAFLVAEFFYGHQGKSITRRCCNKIDRLSRGEDVNQRLRIGGKFFGGKGGI